MMMKAIMDGPTDHRKAGRHTFTPKQRHQPTCPPNSAASCPVVKSYTRAFLSLLPVNR